MASAQFFERIIAHCQRLYHCKADSDFPLIHLLSYPFSPMLDLAQLETARPRLESELKSCFDTLRSLKVDVAAIACNTLHLFLTPSMTHCLEFVSIGEAIRPRVRSSPLILSSGTSAQLRLHNRFFPSLYPTPEDQYILDAIIDAILAGTLSPKETAEIQRIISQYPESTQVVLGCTEFSLLHYHYPIKGPFEILDATELLTEQLTHTLIG